MVRQSLGDLLGNLDDAPALVATLNPEPAPSQVAPEPIAAAPKPQETPAAHPVKPAAYQDAEYLPTYLRLVRKETRLREDQQNQLTLEARRLNRKKAPGTPRITDNTLIRVAVDLLLERVGRANGDDELSILKSLMR